MAERAWLLRIAPGGKDYVANALRDDDLIIGWSDAEGLLASDLDWTGFRAKVRQAYYAKDSDNARAGRAAGNMWRFVREMQVGDLVVVPHGNGFYVARISEGPRHEALKVEEDSAHRRKVDWLNGKKPISREIAKSALQSRMTVRGTCVEATDLLPAIRDALDAASKSAKPTFHQDLRKRLIHNTLEELRSGRLNDYGFEVLLNDLMLALGASKSRIVPRNQDKGADIVATFELAGAFEFVVAVQAKHYQPEPPVPRGVVDELVQGVEAESADLGMIVTTGSFSPDTVAYAAAEAERVGVNLKLVDGPALAALFVRAGVTGA